MISLASKDAGKQAKQAKTLKPPQSLPSGVVWAWSSLHFLASTRVLLHTTLGGSVPQLLAASLHPLARMSTKAGYEEAKGGPACRYQCFGMFSVSGVILRVGVGFGQAGPFRRGGWGLKRRIQREQGGNSMHSAF